MTPENEVIVYAVRAVVQHLIQQGVIDENSFKEHMNGAEFELRKGLSPEAQEASPIIDQVFGVITSQIKD